MVSEWKKTTLADVSSNISYGYTESATTEKIGPRFLRITDIQNGIVDWQTVPYCPISDSNQAKYMLKRGDIVVARTGNSTGENYIFDSEEEAVFASYLIRFKISPEKANPHFVWYSMRSPSWWAFVNTSKTGSAQAGANAKVLGRFALNLPPITEQQRIAHILGTLDSKIELNRQMNKTLEAMAQALFKSWFIDFDPVIDKALAAGNEIPESLQEKAVLRQTLGNQRKPIPFEICNLFPNEFVESELGWIPKGWAITSLSNLTTELRRGISPKYCEEEGVRVVNQRCIRNHEISWNCARRHDTTKKKINERLLQPGDLLINSTGVGTLGRMAPVIALEEPTVADSHITIVRPDHKIYEPFLFTRLMLTLEPLVESMGEGSTGQTELNRLNLGNLVVIVPSKAIQEAVEGYFRGFSEQVSVNCKNIQTLSVLRDTILPKLISGEIRVLEAEDMLAEVMHE